MTKSKYDPLCAYLREQSLSELTISFREIEKILGAPLPDSALRPQWWANVSDPQTTHVQRRAWGSAGFDAFLHAGRKVRFKRMGS